MRIRFEDFVLNPIGKTLEIYNFVGLKMNMHIKSWLDKSTTHCNNENLSKTRQFGIRRNVLSVLKGWRERLKFTQVQEIQSKCQQVLDKLQYEVYQTDTDFKNFKTMHFEPYW